MHTTPRLIVILVLCFYVTPLLSAADRKQPRSAAIATAHPIATQAGFEMIALGGNAFDAAVAISATLAVVEPYSSGMGGGGFWLLHDSRNNRNVVIDGRERAPFAATPTMYQDKEGNIIKGRSVSGALAAGIPGQAAALVHIANKYGRLPLSKSFAPAIRAARQGFKVNSRYQKLANFRLKDLQRSTAAAAIFLVNNKVPALGHNIIQLDLANTLLKMTELGFKGFYDGDVAKKLVASSRAAHGIWTLQDLLQYKIIERQPLVGHYQNYTITSVPPPSSGGVALLSMFNMLSQFKFAQMSAVQQKHLLIEVMRRAYRDRAAFLGDSDVVDVPVQKLISKQHARNLIKDLNLTKATASNTLGNKLESIEGQDTTHFSVMDANGNRVSATLSINYPFGAAFVAAGTGILFNDEMDDFSAKPGVPNVYGLVGGAANAIAPGKRMLSSMSPSFIENKHSVAIIGTPGGSRIITMVFHGMLAFIQGQSATEIVNVARYHHQYIPDVIQLEPNALTKNERSEIQKLGHQLQILDSSYGNMQLVIYNKKSKKFSVASDARGTGLAVSQ